VAGRLVFKQTDMKTEKKVSEIEIINALLQLPSAQFVAQIYHMFPFTTCFGLMGPSSSGTSGFYNRLFLFLLLSPHWPV
jgi:hypothetical protein